MAARLLRSKYHRPIRETVHDKLLIFPPSTTVSTGGLPVHCPEGKKVLGGGATAFLTFGGEIVVGGSPAVSFAGGSYPLDEDSWAVLYNYTSGTSAVGLRAFATCAY